MARRAPNPFQGDLFTTDIGTGYVAPVRERDLAPAAPPPSEDRTVEVASAPNPAMTPVERLVAAGLVMPDWARHGGYIGDHDAPIKPRSLATPLIAYVIGGGGLRLYLTTPAAGSLPFVQRVERITGLRAVWDETELERPYLYMKFHAEDLATDVGWETLAGTLGHTDRDLIERATAKAVACKWLSVANARSLLAAAGVEEHRRRDLASVGTLRNGMVYLDNDAPAWTIIHAIEDGLVTPVDRNENWRGFEASLTAAGCEKLGLPPRRQGPDRRFSGRPL